MGGGIMFNHMVTMNYCMMTSIKIVGVFFFFNMSIQTSSVLLKYLTIKYELNIHLTEPKRNYQLKAQRQYHSKLKITMRYHSETGKNINAQFTW